MIFDEPPLLLVVPLDTVVVHDPYGATETFVILEVFLPVGHDFFGQDDGVEPLKGNVRV